MEMYGLSDKEFRKKSTLKSVNYKNTKTHN